MQSLFLGPGGRKIRTHPAIFWTPLAAILKLGTVRPIWPESPSKFKIHQEQKINIYALNPAEDPEKVVQLNGWTFSDTTRFSPRGVQRSCGSGSHTLSLSTRVQCTCAGNLKWNVRLIRILRTKYIFPKSLRPNFPCRKGIRPIRCTSVHTHLLHRSVQNLPVTFARFSEY
jgi:hypothetical protein